MACGLIGQMRKSGPYPQADLGQLASRFQRKLLLWQERADPLQRNIGYVDGLLLHNWHGKKIDRQYADRWRVYLRNNYDPDADLKRDAQGAYQLTNHNPRLRDEIRCFFRARNEDSIDLA